MCVQAVGRDKKRAEESHDAEQRAAEMVARLESRMRELELERQIYVNSFLGRLDALHRSPVTLGERCALINEILDGQSARFSYLDPDLINTRSLSSPNSVVRSQRALSAL